MQKTAANGINIMQTGVVKSTAKKNTERLKTVTVTANPRDILFDGNGLDSVRGLRLSSLASAIRLKALAALLAEKRAIITAKMRFISRLSERTTAAKPCGSENRLCGNIVRVENLPNTVVGLLEYAVFIPPVGDLFQDIFGDFCLYLGGTAAF